MMTFFFEENSHQVFTLLLVTELSSYLQEHVLTGGHGLMVDGYYPVIQALSQGLDIRLNQRCVFCSFPTYIIQGIISVWLSHMFF